MNKLFKIMTAYDIMIIIGVLLISISILLFPFWRGENSNSGDKVINISQNGKIVKRIPVAETIDNKTLIEVEGPIGIHKIELNQGRVRVYEAPADDPLKLCEKTGWIDSEGPIIVCVPNNLSIWLESTNSDIDGMSW